MRTARKNGRGAKSLFPPLRGESWVNRDPELPIRIVLHGLEGEIEIDGERYMNQMAGLRNRLDDETTAGILTFVRASWENGQGAVTAEEVARVRAATATRKTMWTPEEVMTEVPPSGQRKR